LTGSLGATEGALRTPLIAAQGAHAQWKGMVPVTPASAQEVADLLEESAASSRAIAVVGNNSKRLMAGPIEPCDVVLSTSRLNRVLQYEPNDLTISVETGMPWSELQQLLAGRSQMIALDPPFWREATVGGVVASNSSGSLRRAFGTARDLVIGMQFAMLDGKIGRTGGMVVKNVAGLDIGKLLIGSFGTLAVITSLNFRLHALPPELNTFLFSFPDLERAIEKRDALLAGVFRPLAIDLLSPTAAVRFSRHGYLLVIRAGGSKRVLDRYERDLSDSERLTGQDDSALWTQIREFPAEFLKSEAQGVIIRVSTPLSGVGEMLRQFTGACISRAGSGVNYLYLREWQESSILREVTAKQGWHAVVEFAPDDVRSNQELWPVPPSQLDASFAMMKGVKEMFDPAHLLNRSRLYGRI
jgi:glycolate oxidase FAD binding subunit